MKVFNIIDPNKLIPIDDTGFALNEQRQIICHYSEFSICEQSPYRQLNYQVIAPRTLYSKICDLLDQIQYMDVSFPIRAKNKKHFIVFNGWDISSAALKWLEMDAIVEVENESN